MNRFEMERLAMQFRCGDLAVALKFPGEDGGKVVVGAERLAIGRLMFLTKMSAARFVALERINAHELGEFEEIGHATGAFERLIEIVSFAGNAHRSPKFVAQLRDFRERFAQSLSVSGHATFVPEKRSELTMDGVERTIAVHAKDAVDLSAHIGLGF